MRVVTYNVHGWVDASMIPNPTRVVALLRRLDADVIALQEVTAGFGFDVPDEWYDSDEESSRGYVPPSVWEVANALGMHATIAPAGWGSNVLLTRKRPLRTDAVTIGSGPGGTRSAAFATIETPMGSVTFVGTHLDPASESARMTQLRNLAEIVGDRKAVVMGDFNALRFSDYTRDRLEEIAEERLVAGVEEPSEAVVRHADAMGWIDLARFSGVETATEYYRSFRKPLPHDLAVTSNFGTRVDYVWATVALADTVDVTSARTIRSNAIDHLGS
jgi:endonuclease/exonuclease/phosphatase family metal-dependent hydrolase